MSRTSDFYEKYNNKEIMDCQYLGKWIYFDFDGLTFCFSRTSEHTMDNPLICIKEELIKGDFDYALYMNRLVKLYEMNQKGNGQRNGCKHLVKKVFEGISDKIENISINNYRDCNSRVCEMVGI